MKRLLGFSVLVFATLLPTPLRATDEIRILRGTFVVGHTPQPQFDVEGTLGL